MKARLKRIATNALLGITSLCVMYAVLEGVARLLPDDLYPYQNDYSRYVYHEELIFDHKRGYEDRLEVLVGENETVEIDVRISSQGLRDRELAPKAEGEYRILMAGDSFTFGRGLETEQTIPGRLGAFLKNRNVTVANFGVSGYSPWQERRALQLRGYALEPDMVILQLFPENDLPEGLEGDPETEKRYLRSYREHWARQIRQFKGQATVPGRIELWMSEHSDAYATMKAKLGRRYLISDLIRAFDFAGIWSEGPLPTSLGRKFQVETELKEEYPELAYAWEKFERDIIGIRDDCRERGVELLVYAIPSKAVAETSRWERHTGHDPAAYERGKSHRKTEEICNRAGIAYVDVASALTLEHDRQKLYFPADGHLNADGTTFVAEMLRDCLAGAEFFGGGDSSLRSE